MWDTAQKSLGNTALELASHFQRFQQISESRRCWLLPLLTSKKQEQHKQRNHFWDVQVSRIAFGKNRFPRKF